MKGHYDPQLLGKYCCGRHDLCVALFLAESTLGILEFALATLVSSTTP